jgi:RNA-binding protein
MKKLNSMQAKYLRGLAHDFKPVVLVGQKGLSQTLIQSVDEAFQRHELIKIKFIDYKEKAQKKEIAAAIENETDCRMAGMIGHIAIFYKPQSDPDKRKIILPE